MPKASAVSVLIVDDQQSMRGICKYILTQLGFKDIIEAKSGRDALGKLEKSNVDLIISDWNMEDIDGLTLLKVPGFCLGATQADWLVVTDTQATFSGAASVNGRSGYRYLVSLVDGGHGGRADLVRVRVWSSDGGAVLLDTQPGAPLTAAPTTPLQGNVTVHG